MVRLNAKMKQELDEVSEPDTYRTYALIVSLLILTFAGSMLIWIILASADAHFATQFILWVATLVGYNIALNAAQTMLAASRYLRDGDPDKPAHNPCADNEDGGIPPDLR